MISGERTALGGPNSTLNGFKLFPFRFKFFNNAWWITDFEQSFTFVAREFGSRLREMARQTFSGSPQWGHVSLSGMCVAARRV